MVLFSDNGNISIRQLQSIIIINLLGVLIITVPKVSVDTFGGMAWIITAFTTVICAFFSIGIAQLGKSFAKSSMDFGGYLPGRLISILILFGFFVKMIFTGGFILRLYSQIIGDTLLKKTPVWIICAAAILCCIYCAKGGSEVIGRISEILFVIVTITLIIFIVFLARDIEFKEFASVEINDSANLINDFFTVFVYFNSLDMILMFMRYTKNKNDTGYQVAKATSLAGIIITFITVMLISYYGTNGTKSEMWPVFEMLNSTDISLSPIQRQDIFISGIIVSLCFCVVCYHIFFSAQLLKHNMKIKSDCVWFTGMLAFLISFIPQDFFSAFNYYSILCSTIGVFYFVGLSAIFFIYKLWKKKV